MHPRSVPLCTLVALVVLLLCACGATPTAPPVPPTATPVPPTATPLPPTANPTSSAKAVPILPNAEWPKQVNVGPYSLYTHCYGSGDPVVMIEPGIGNTVPSWVNVTSLLKNTTTVCVYNRANLAGSGFITTARSSGQIIEDMHNLVAALEIKKPFVLVGHSMGGYQAILYTAKWPTDVAALVLVESVAPDQGARLLATMPAAVAGEETALTSLRNNWVNWPPSAPMWPENWDVAKSDAEIKAVTSLGKVPLTVISGGVTGLIRELPVAKGDWLPAYAGARIEMQKDLLKLSTNSTFIVADKSGHMVHVDDAPLAADTIIKIVEQVRKK